MAKEESMEEAPDLEMILGEGADGGDGKDGGEEYGGDELEQACADLADKLGVQPADPKAFCEALRAFVDLVIDKRDEESEKDEESEDADLAGLGEKEEK